MLESTENASGTVLVTAVTDWLMQQALDHADLETIFDGCCQQLVAAGLPISRAMVTFRTLHPLYASTIQFWRRGEAVESSRTRHENAFSSDDFTNSPIHLLMTTDIDFIRRRLSGPTATLDFAVLDDLQQQGFTDYFAYKVGYSSGVQTDDYKNGIIGSWATERSGGFTDQEIVWLLRVQKRLAVACKMQIQEGVTQNLVDAYLGPNAADRVLGGQIKRGDGEQMDAVVWYSDMRDSTRWADRLEADEFFRLVNHYFECTAGAVIANGGEVLRFIGDAVLAIFPYTSISGSRRAANDALKAAREAHERLQVLNDQRASNAEPPVNYGLGLHVGELTFGNIGVPERLEFSVVGPTVNEVARLESLTKTLGERVLVSETFADLVNTECAPMGLHRLRGVGEEIELYAPRLF